MKEQGYMFSVPSHKLLRVCCIDHIIWLNVISESNQLFTFSPDSNTINGRQNLIDEKSCCLGYHVSAAVHRFHLNSGNYRIERLWLI